jgi:hypothetical protein
MKTTSLVMLSVGLILSAYTQPNNLQIEENNNFVIPVIKNQPFKSGEYLKYRLHYGFIDAGEAEVTVREEYNTKLGRKVYHMVGEGRSTGTFDWFFKVRDRFESYTDAEGLFPYEFKRDCNEGGFIIKQNYTFFPKNSMMNNGEGKWIKTPQFVHDMVSSFYYARALDLSNLKKGDILKVECMVDSELWPFQIKYVGIETIKVKKQKYRCMKFRPVVQKGRIFKDEEDLNIWITDDQNKIPIMAEAKILVGSIKLELTDFRGLAYPIAAVNK